MEKYINKKTFSIFSFIISIFLGIIWILNGILTQEKLLQSCCIICIIHLLIDTNIWVFHQRGFTDGIMSVIFIWILSLFGGIITSFIGIFELTLLTIVFLYTRDKYLKKIEQM